MKVLLSIKPEYADKILNGTKHYEFRKSAFKREGIKTVVVYSTLPVGKVVGEFDIEEILTDTPDELWKLTKENAGISKNFFDEYYSGKDSAVAIKVGNIQRYKQAIELSQLGHGITAPQSYRYLN
ncbi:ASCH domain-containing protein [Alteromonas sp. a30]|uniref:ASCH domain-containing protein n=1 Tax=Alteromonas sp. a30 TaxID=2730917 RepID=UPI00227E22D6|nr:ASCH domain-containing protein [Alteromonas sp. a30]MCY7296130.1 ASCH domain-containing protein [Alteromonas sp. a30]